MVFAEEAMRDQIRCAHCSCLFFPNPRVKRQRYCGKKECQRARKRLWQRDKLARDPDYKLNRRESNEQWRTRHPGYWRDYRLRNPEYAVRNRELQKVRDSREIDLAKMDALEPQALVMQGTYYLVPESANLAKMDESAVKVYLIPAT